MGKSLKEMITIKNKYQRQIYDTINKHENKIRNVINNTFEYTNMEIENIHVYFDEIDNLYDINIRFKECYSIPITFLNDLNKNYNFILIKFESNVLELFLYLEYLEEE